MISFILFITLALAGMVIATPFKRAPAVSLSRRQSNPVANCANQTQAAFVIAAHAEAVALASAAIGYIDDFGVTDEAFIDYFGDSQDDTMQSDVYSDIASEDSLTLYCTDPNTICAGNSAIGNFGAYATSSGSGIVFCPSFYNQVDTGHLCTGTTVDEGGIRGATTLYVISQDVDQIGNFLENQDCSDARNLAVDDPISAGNDTENYSCFAMQVYVNTQCM